MRPAGAAARTTRRVGAVVAVLVATVSLASPASASTIERRSHGDDGAVRRVLMISLPYVAWTDLNTTELPNLNRLLDRSAIANLSTRAPTLGVDLAGGYVTLGSGDKAVGGNPLSDGAALGVSEEFGGDTAAQVFTQRTGRVARHGLVHLGIADIEAANSASIFDADVGVLGDALAKAGYSRAVIANGDGSQPPDPADVYRREAVAALMGSNGKVPGGRVDRGLLEAAPRYAFGLRTNIDAYVDAFTRAWTPSSVVLVEASDLVRADALLQFADDAARDVLRKRALRHTDELVGRLLEHVDPSRDAVIVVGPAPSEQERMLTIAAVRAPGFQAGLLRSPTTQRSGFVQLIDLAPTVLKMIGAPRPDTMRGRVLQGGDGGGDANDRRAFLAEADAASRFRERIQLPVAVIFIVFQGLFAFGAVLAFTRVGRLRHIDVLPTLGSILLAYIPAAYLARAFPLQDAGIVPYYAFLIGVSIVLGVGARILGRRHEIDPLLLGLGLVVVLLVGDVVVLGSRLQFNSALGFSPEVAGRFVGYGNAGYAALAGAAVLLAGLVAHRIAGPRGIRIALAVLVVALLADGAPFWGADVGGVLSMVPGFGITALLLLGRRVTRRSVVIAAGATLVAIVAATGVDLLRAPGQRTHLGRLAEQVRHEGISAFTSVIGRKIEMNLATLTSSVWRLLIPIVLALVAYLAFAPPHRLVELLRRIPQLRPTLIGFAVVMVLGYALNDSGVVVPGVMLGVLSPVLVTLTVPHRAATARAPAPAVKGKKAAART